MVNSEAILRDSVVTNLLFFKSRCLGTHATTVQGWCDNRNFAVRREIEDYCRTRVEEIVRRLDPSRILVLGLATWDKVAEGEINRVTRRTRTSGRLAVTGAVFDRSALGIIHPTGARIGEYEFHVLGSFLHDFLISRQ